jgi:SMI1-KNR4 cell-wall
MEKWYKLLEKIQIDKALNVLSSQELQAFEIENDISLPNGYKEFCQVFGSGVFENKIRIYCPPQIEETRNFISLLDNDLGNLRRLPDFQAEKAEEISKLFGNLLAFGGTWDADIFLWDLSSGNLDDSDFDIYVIDLDSFESDGGVVKLVGRNFYSFIESAALNIKIGSFFSEYNYPEKMFEAKFFPLANNQLYFDIVVKTLVMSYPQDFADWLLGQNHILTCVDWWEIFYNSEEMKALILKGEDFILQIEVRTRVDSSIPIQLFEDYLRLSDKFSGKQITQVVIYLKHTQSPLVYQTSYESPGISHTFRVIRLWEQPTDVFSRKGLLPLSILSNTQEREDTLRQAVNVINACCDPEDGVIIGSLEILARLVMDNNVIKSVLE